MSYLPPRYLFRRFELLRGLRSGGRFLEIGAADLTLTRELLKRFDSGVGIDFTPDIKDAHSKLPVADQSRLDVMCGDFFELDLQGSFDCIITCEVMEHVEADGRFLKRINDLLAPGGQLVLSVPARQKYWTVHDEIVGHLRRYEKPELEQLMASSGFDNARVVSYGWPWVNFLRLPRAMLANAQARDRAEWDTHTQTIESNHRQIPQGLSDSPIALITRPGVFAPFAWLSSIFNRFDLSDGYVAFADKDS